MAGQPKDACDWVLNDMDFRFSKPGPYGGRFYTQFYLDENCCFHKDDGPAYISYEGEKVWFQHGLRHRDGGLPAYEGSNGDRAWYENGVYHREAGPAFMCEGREEWWIRGKQLAAGEADAYRQWLESGGKPSYDAFVTYCEHCKIVEKMSFEFTDGGTQRAVPLLKPPRFNK
jgi:hypothetical protein